MLRLIRANRTSDYTVPHDAPVVPTTTTATTTSEESTTVELTVGEAVGESTVSMNCAETNVQTAPVGGAMDGLLLFDDRVTSSSSELPTERKRSLTTNQKGIYTRIPLMDRVISSSVTSTSLEEADQVNLQQPSLTLEAKEVTQEVDVMTETDKITCLWSCETDRVWFERDRRKVPTYRRFTNAEYNAREERRYFYQSNNEDVELSHWSWDPEGKGPIPLPMDQLGNGERQQRKNMIFKLQSRMMNKDDFVRWERSKYKLYPIDLIRARNSKSSLGPQSGENHSTLLTPDNLKETT